MDVDPKEGVGVLRRDLARCAFALGAVRPPRFGLEIELLPLHADTRTPVPIRSRQGPDLLGLVSSYADLAGWEEVRDDAVPHFVVPGIGVLGFEPGGQVEFSSVPMDSGSRVLRATERIFVPLSDYARDRGVELVAAGIDPFNPVEAAQLQVPSERYRRMASHFDRRGIQGRRMMLQTAAIHVNLDFAEDPFSSWRVANRLVPYLIAIFANSRWYAGQDTGARSFRSVQWQTLDPSRTGVFGQPGDPVEDYLRFVLGAPAILLGGAGSAARPFWEWLSPSGQPEDVWADHMSTLFPEVRPRGHLEIRAVDALPLQWLPAVVVLAAGLLYDREARAEADRWLPCIGAKELDAAARRGLSAPSVQEGAVALFELALRGAHRLGEGVLEPDDLDVARDFLRLFTARALDPGSGALEVECIPSSA